MVCHSGVHRRHAGDVDDDHLRAVRADSPEQLLRQLARALRVDHADDRENQQPFADLQHRGGEFADCLLLLADDALALLDESYGDCIRNSIGSGLVGVQDTVQLFEIGLILCEERTGQHVAQEQNDSNDFVRFHASGNDAFGKVARIGLQRFERPRFQSLHVAVVNRSGFRKDFFLAHCREQAGFRDAAHPLLAELSAVLAKMRYQLPEEFRCRFETRMFACKAHVRRRISCPVLFLCHGSALLGAGAQHTLHLAPVRKLFNNYDRTPDATISRTS